MSALLTALIFFFFVSLPPAAADDESPLNQWVKDHVKGSLRYKNFAHFYRNDHEKMVRQEGILRLDVEEKFDDHWRLFLTPQWKADTANYTAGAFQYFRDKSLRDPYFYIREGHLKYSGDSFDMSVGKQFYTWGTAEGYNPTDNLNPRDYHDVPDREKMGIFSFAASYYPQDASVTLVVIPLFTPSRLPLEHSRWSATDQNGQRPEAQGSGTAPDITIGRRELPGARPDKTQFGLRAKKSVAGWDLSTSYFDGFDTLPVIHQTGKSARPRFNRMHVIGTDFTTTSGKLEYHGELAAKLYEGGRANSILPFIFGGTYTWDEDQVVWLGLNQVILTTEYASDITLRQRDNHAYKESGIFTRPFQNSFLNRLALKYDENNELHFSGNYNIRQHATKHHRNNSYLQPKVIHKFSDSLKAEGGVELFWGDHNSFWGKWKKNDRSFFNLVYQF